MKRREFLGSSLAAGAAALLTPVAALADTVSDTPAPAQAPADIVGDTPVAAPAPDIATISVNRAWFNNNLMSYFQIYDDAGVAVLAALVEIKDWGTGDYLVLDQFSVVFQTAGGSRLDGLRLLTCAQGQFQLALEPPYTSTSGDAQMYEAHFSLLV
jgi:hypothetical protein